MQVRFLPAEPINKLSLPAHKNTRQMKRMTIKGNKALAAELCVSQWTIWNWKASGILDRAIISEFRRTIIYDLEKVYECLNHNKR